MSHISALGEKVVKLFRIFICILAMSSLSSCIAPNVEKPSIVQVKVTEKIAASQPLAAKLPLQIATWSPNKTDGRFTAMVSGYLTVVNNCLALTRDSTEVTTKDNTYLLVLADTSFSWDADKEILLFEGKPYHIGDELYLGGSAFIYPNANITDQVKVNWIECGLDKGWLGG